MQRFLVVAAIAACGSSPQGPTPPPSPPVVELCDSVFDMFRRDVHPSMTAPEVSRVITDRSWIVVDQAITALGGKIPIELTEADTDVVVQCLSNEWAIYARISGHSAPTFASFLAAGSDVRLIEYALVSPGGKIERFR